MSATPDPTPESTAVPAGRHGADDVLVLDHVSAGYGPFRAVFDVSLAVPAGTACALLGPNGAGKTTVARVCTGLVRPTAGRVVVAGEDVTGRKPYRIARLGVAHAPEGRSVFASLTVAENLELGFRQALGKDGAATAVDEAYALFPRLGERRAQIAGTLSGGEQRMLSLARVLVHPPKLLVVDELSLGLAPIVVEEVYQNLAAVKAKGTTVLVIEQHIDQALGIADQVVVLARGRVTYAGPPTSAEALAEHMLPGAAPTA